ncbi:MAG TPA: hypothetical protein DCG57_19240 [Candidatus Riflebacteria bacterium]|jgi:uncharacterized protein YebE (UPF0316 family)|nr:MAG: hypothetical protein CVV41_21870 [Candidatus Riflebacteria bacterium HGW-Riflebacteria-1]HAE40744.1 hypothetical protein [Candidatus Riflebacteria bacterium]
MDMTVILTGLAVFMARIVDVSVGTIRIISIVNGRMKTAFVLGFIEVSIWLLVISTVLAKINESPVIAVFYALGYASGNVAGILIEKRISVGSSLLRIISMEKGLELATEFKRLGFQVVSFDGIESDRAIKEIEIPCRRKDIDRLVDIARKIEPDAFFVTANIGVGPKIRYPVMQPPTGWRAIFKRK